MSSTGPSFSLPHARLPVLQQLPLDSITVYDTATHCYLLGTDSLQKNYYLLSLRKHTPEHIPSSSAVGSSNVATSAGNDAHQSITVSGSEAERGRGRAGTTCLPSASHALSSGLDDLHDFTSYVVYSQTEAGALVDALQREHGALMRTLSAVALLGAVRFTAGYYVVLVTERRMAGYLGVHRIFEAASAELVSLQLDPEWVAEAEAQSREMEQRLHLSDGVGPHGVDGGFLPFVLKQAASGGWRKPSSPLRSRLAKAFHSRKSSSCAGTGGSSASAASYLFSRRSLEEQYRQQFVSSLSRASSFFYSHSYDLTNTLQRNMLAAGSTLTDGTQAAAPPGGDDGASEVGAEPYPSAAQPLQPRMQYVWNEYLWEPWELSHRDFGGDEAEASENATTANECDTGQEAHPTGGAGRETVPQYPSALSRWRVFLVHGYITQRVVAIRRPTFQTLLVTLIARVGKGSAGVRYHRRGLNSDGHVANHVEVEQIITDEASWNATFTAATLSSYIQLRGSVPVRWYHPLKASRLLPKPPIVIGPHDSQWSETCFHFQKLVEQYGCPIIVHDLLKRQEGKARESLLGDAYRQAVRALAAAVDRASTLVDSEATRRDADKGSDTGKPPRISSRCVLRYETTDLRRLGQLAWNTMTATAEQHFRAVRCFVTRRCSSNTTTGLADRREDGLYRGNMHTTNEDNEFAVSYDAAHSSEGDVAEVVQLQNGVVRSNCLDCIDRTNLGQLFHGLHALGEQLSALGFLRNATDVCNSPAVMEMLLEMYLAMGDAIAIQYGGSAQVGAGVLHRGAGWDQLMGVKRLYNNVMGDREKQEAMNLFLGRKQPQPRPGSRACNAEMHSPAQVVCLSPAPALSPSTAAFASLGRGSPVREDDAAPSGSLFSGIRKAASRWWNEAGSSSGFASGAAATTTALWVSSHTSVEVEAEADYYDQVSGAPRLPPAGLLASWWVKPLCRFEMWYAARGVRPRPRTARGAGNAADAVGEPSMREVPMPHVLHRSSVTGDLSSSPAAFHGPPPMPCGSMSTRDNEVFPEVYSGDEIALRILAAETQAQKHWLLFIATLERQASLAPMRRDETTHPHHDKCKGTPRDGSTSDTSAALHLSSLSYSISGSVATSGPSKAPQRVRWSHEGDSILQGLIRPLGQDDMGEMTTGMTSITSFSSAGGTAVSLKSCDLPRRESPLVCVSEGAHSAPSAPLLTAPLRLFTEPWVILHTTTHLLPMETVTGATSLSTHTLRLSTAVFPSLSLPRPRRKRAARINIHEAPCCEPSYCVKQAVAHHLFGRLPPAVAAITAHSPPRIPEEQYQPWRSPRRIHSHDDFPRIVRNSLFAQQEADLERLAYREVLWLEEDADTEAAKVRGALAEPSKQPASHPSMAQLSSPRMVPWALSPHEVADHQFVAALIVNRFGTPRVWGIGVITQVLQYLVYPERLSEEVLRVLRSSKIQPPLTGAELLSTGAFESIEGDKGTRELRWNAAARRHWHERLVTPLGPTGSVVFRNLSDTSMTHLCTPTPSLRGSVGEDTPLRWTRSASFCESSLAQPRHTGEKQSGYDPVGVAAALLYRLASVLHFAEDNSMDRVTSAGYTRSTPATTVRGNGASVATFMTPRRSYDAGSAQGGCASVVKIAKATAQHEETTSRAYAEAALLPLLEACPNLRFPASAYLPGLSPEQKNLSESLRQQWLLCGLLQPIFPRSLLTPPTLHDLLNDFFSALLLDDGPAQDSLDEAAGRSGLCRRRSDCHVRYTFVLPHPQTTSMQQWTSRQHSSGGAGGSGRSSNGRFSYRLPIGISPLLSSSQPQELPSTHGDMASPVSNAASKTLHIPATLKVNYCCAALDLYYWSVAHSPLFATSPVRGSRGASLVSRDGRSVNTTTALAAWRLLWWAVDNSFIVPVVRRRGQGTLEMLADETALFCLRRDVVRVALNVERHCREDVWCPQQPEMLTSSATVVAGSSAIYGVDLAPSVSRLYRPLCRSAIARILALSETLASLGLNAATRVQEFFRDRIVHGWARQSFGSAVLTTTTVSTPSSSNAGSGSSAVTAATVVRCFHQLAEECLRSVYSVMVALRHVSLAAFARDAAMHSYIVFFVNVYNAAYVAAWITNVKELVSNGAAAAAADANSPQKNSHRSQYTGPPRKPKLRTIDLFPLPTLCNTNHACFMHAYGVDIGGLFLSLEEIKYGILGGNRAPPYCDLPLWSPVTSSGGDQLNPLRLERSRELSGRQQVQRLVPLHLCAEVTESARLEALQCHPHLQAALDLTDMCEALDPFREETDADGDRNSAYAKTVRQPPSSAGLGLMRSSSSSPHLPCVLQPSSSSSADVAGPSENPTWQSARESLTPASSMSPSKILPCSGNVGERRRRRQKLVDLWSLDVVRYLPFRIVLQLIDTYLPPPVLHLCAGSVDMEGRESFGGIVGGSGANSASGSASTSPARDLRSIAHLDGRDTVPWFLQPIFNTMPLVHDSLQSSKVGATYTVALDGDGPAAGTLVPQVSQDANGVLLQQCRMWSSPSYYIVGGDGASCDEAVSRSLQLLQALSGSYIGAGLYHPIHLDTAGGSTADTAPRGPAQHLCRPLHADEPFAQLLSTEAAFRSAILTTDPHIFRSTSASSSPPPAKSSPQTTPTSRRMRPLPSPLMLPTDLSQPPHLRGMGGTTGMYANIAQYGARGLPGGSGSSNASCSATLQNTMKPLLYEWCRSLEEETGISTSPPGCERQMLATLKMVRLLEESHASGKAVRAAQAAMRSD